MLLVFFGNKRIWKSEAGDNGLVFKVPTLTPRRLFFSGGGIAKRMEGGGCVVKMLSLRFVFVIEAIIYGTTATALNADVGSECLCDGVRLLCPNTHPANLIENEMSRCENGTTLVIVWGTGSCSPLAFFNQSGYDRLLILPFKEAERSCPCYCPYVPVDGAQICC